MDNLTMLKAFIALCEVKEEKAERQAALLKAAFFGPDSDLEILIEKGVDFSTRLIDREYSVLHIAASIGRVNDISILLDYGFDIEENSAINSRTPLMAAADVGEVEAVKFLIQKGALVEARDDSGETALSLAVVAGELKATQALLDLGADLESQDNLGYTPIRKAAGSGRGKLVQLLIHKGANFRAKDVNGWSSLHQAACNGHTEVVRILLESGADAEEKEIGGRSALGVAQHHGRHSVVQILLEHEQRDLPRQSTSLDKASFVRTIPNDYSRYTPLDQENGEIRLLRIKTFPGEGLLTCSVVRTSLDDHPRYTALSYCWGSLKKTVPISMCFEDKEIIDCYWTNNADSGSGDEADSETSGNANAESGDNADSGSDQDPPAVVANFNITVNLYDALRSFKHHSDDVFIWSDMLCINQDDVDERSQQVAIMSKIYTEATNVTVWLGGDPDSKSDILFPDEAENFDIFMQLLDKLSSTKSKYLDDKWTSMCNDFVDNDDYDDTIDWNELGQPFEIPYKSIATDLYLMYSTMPEDTIELIQSTKSKDIVDLESYFLKTILGEDSLVLRFATFLSIDHDTEFNDKQEATWQSLFDVITRWHKTVFSPWFGRVWVIREIVHSDIVRVRHCNTQIDWDLMLNYYSIYETLNSAWSAHASDLTLSIPNFSIYFRNGLMRWFSLWEKMDQLKEREVAFIDILVAANDFLSTDPRDKLYAIAPLASEIEPDGLIPDYSQPVEAVYANFTKWFIQEHQSLRILSVCRHFHRKDSESIKDVRPLPNLPTWTPDYRDISYLQICMNSDTTTFYCADGRKPAKVLKEDNPMSLRVEGVALAHVVNAIKLDPTPYWSDLWGCLKMTGFLPLKVEHTSTTDNIKDVKKSHLTLERYFRTLAASVLVGPRQLGVFAQILSRTDSNSNLKCSWSEDHFLRKYAEYSTQPYNFSELCKCLSLYMVATRANNLFVSHDNRLGLGPAQMKEGDLVVILFGSCVPFVVREKTLPEKATTAERAKWLQDGPVYQLIGECYLDGRMHGEVFEDPMFEDPLHADPLDVDRVLYPGPKTEWNVRDGGAAVEAGRKGVYRRKFFHLQ